MKWIDRTLGLFLHVIDVFATVVVPMMVTLWVEAVDSIKVPVLTFAPSEVPVVSEPPASLRTRLRRQSRSLSSLTEEEWKELVQGFESDLRCVYDDMRVLLQRSIQHKHQHEVQTQAQVEAQAQDVPATSSPAKMTGPISSPDGAAVVPTMRRDRSNNETTPFRPNMVLPAAETADNSDASSAQIHASLGQASLRVHNRRPAFVESSSISPSHRSTRFRAKLDKLFSPAHTSTSTRDSEPSSIAKIA